MKKVLLISLLWSPSWGAPAIDFFNDATTTEGVVEGVTFREPLKTNEAKKEEPVSMRGIIVDGEMPKPQVTEVSPSVPQPLPKDARSAWGGNGEISPDAIGWSVPATFPMMNIQRPQNHRLRTPPKPSLGQYMASVWQ